MAGIKPPVVFLGPSVSVEEAARILPGAQFCPPAGRGDLYRARFFNASILVFVDGVFLQQHAPSPREVVDVARDGALVVGASSLGAIRAAECWPAGVRGAGLIYRLYRAGRLLSDDEVAVIFDPHSREALSVPLVNVRHATRRAVKAGLLARSQARAIVDAASGLFYAHRTWEEILAAASISLGPEPRRYLEACNLKREDALRALALVGRWMERVPDLAARHARRHQAPFAFPEHVREPPADPLAGMAPADARRDLAIWLLASGRYRRHIGALTAPVPPDSDSEALMDGDSARASGERARRVASLDPLIGDFDAFADRLWLQLETAGELEAELFRWQAVEQLGGSAAAPAHPMERHLAELAMLAEHGMCSWEELATWATAHRLPHEWFGRAREIICRARRAAP